jgi:hypothetical protein
MLSPPVPLRSILILSSNLRLGLFPSCFFTEWYRQSSSTHACKILQKSHPSSFDQPNNIWWAVQTMKLLIMPFSEVSFVFSCVPHHLVLNAFNPCAFLNIKSHVLHPYKMAKLYVCVFCYSYFCITKGKMWFRQNFSWHFLNLISYLFLREWSLLMSFQNTLWLRTALYWKDKHTHILLSIFFYTDVFTADRWRWCVLCSISDVQTYVTALPSHPL